MVFDNPVSQFQIQLDGEKQVFNPGEQVSGQIILVVIKSMKLVKLDVKIAGLSYVHWKERKTRGTGDKKKTVTVHYRSRVHYMGHTAILHSGPTIEPGTYQYPFSFMLDTNLPASFKGAHGNISYHIKAEIERDWAFDNTATTNFTVKGSLDLNLNPQARQPSNTSGQKTLCCWCCASAPIVASISTDRTGYAAGENIFFNAEVNNGSNRDMDGSSMRLLEYVKFKASAKTKTASRNIAMVKKGEISGGGTDSYAGVMLKIPDFVQPTGLGGECSNIEVYYVLQFRVDPSGMGFDLIVELPIIIGTVPLTDFESTFTLPAGYGTDFYPNLPSVNYLTEADYYQQEDADDASDDETKGHNNLAMTPT